MRTDFAKDHAHLDSGRAANSSLRRELSSGSALRQFFWTRQLPPAAFKLEHMLAASSAEAKGPTSAR
jgi:hypothetical protein